MSRHSVKKRGRRGEGGMSRSVRRRKGLGRRLRRGLQGKRSGNNLLVRGNGIDMIYAWEVRPSWRIGCGRGTNGKCESKDET